MRPPAGSGSCFRLTKRVRFAHSHRRPPATLLALRSNLAEGFAPATANASLSAVRGSLKLAWLSGELSQDNYARRMESLKNVQGKSAPGRALNAVEVGKLFAAAASGNSPAASARDAALLAMLYGLGLRRAEAATVELDDYGNVTGTLCVMGKDAGSVLSTQRTGPPPR